MKWSTVIFDLDGTVLNTLEDLLGAMNHALREHGFKEHTLSEMQSYVGDGLYMMAKRAAPEGSGEETVQSVFRCFKSYYSGHLNIKTRPYEGITEMLMALKSAGIKIAVSSNKYDAGAKMLCREHFGGLIDFTVGESETVPKKPDPTGTLLIMKALSADPASTLYVGDSGVDIDTAKNACLPMAAVSWGFRSREQLIQGGAKIIFDDVSALQNYILN